MAFKKITSKRRQNKHSKKGGNGAAEYGSYVWGKGGEQHSISSDTNVIAVVNDPVKYTGANTITGGNVSLGNELTRGGDLTTIGVPTLLVAANQLYKRKTNKRLKDRKISGGAADINLDAMMTKSNELMNMMTPTKMPSVVYTNNNSEAPASSNNVQVFGGSSECMYKNKKMGAGILTDIAVPVVLLTANQLYKSKSIKRRKNGRHKRSRRVRFNKIYTK